MKARSLALLLCLCLQSTALAQTILVTAKDATGNPIPLVDLTLVDAAGNSYATARTGNDGRARMGNADPGMYALFARRVGFRPQRTGYWSVARGDTVAIRVVLAPTTIYLDPVVVRTERDAIRRTTVFGINLRATGGQFITPSEVDRHSLGAMDFVDIVARSGVFGFSVDHFQRCLVSNRGGFGSGCLPVVVDGQLFPDGRDAIDVAPPDFIDYMVVLRGMEVGVRYGSIGSGGIVLIATKRDWMRNGKR